MHRILFSKSGEPVRQELAPTGAPLVAGKQAGWTLDVGPGRRKHLAMASSMNTQVLCTGSSCVFVLNKTHMETFRGNPRPRGGGWGVGVGKDREVGCIVSWTLPSDWPVTGSGCHYNYYVEAHLLSGVPYYYHSLGVLPHGTTRLESLLGTLVARLYW